ncbi:hypothetical protein AAVH_05524 [Aphelenchoides avenae]|nr:hypothetical protein AAVH_05524 [Aphelenchus avenae]
MGKDIFSADEVLPEFQEQVKVIKQTQFWTTALVHHLRVMVRDKDSGLHGSCKPKKQPKDASVAPLNVLERLGRTCEQFSQHYFDSEYYRVLDTTSTVCAALGKSEKHMEKEALEKAIVPIRVWAEEDYPRLLRDLQACTKMHAHMESANKQATKSPEKQQKADTARDQFNRQFEICKAEIARMTKVHKHHTTCLQQLMQLQHGYYKTASEELQKASAQVKLALKANITSAEASSK